MKKVIITSLGMRFYRDDGWEEKDFIPYLKGKILLKGSGKENQYFILSPGSKLNIDKMFEDKIIYEDDVLCKDSWKETKNISGRDAMKLRN